MTEYLINFQINKFTENEKKCQQYIIDNTISKKNIYDKYYIQHSNYSNNNPNPEFSFTSNNVRR